MDRKSFIRNSGSAMGLLLVPGILQRSNAQAKQASTGESEPKIVRGEQGDVLNVIGDIQTHKINGADTNNQIAEWVDEVEPGVGIPPHIHEREDEIFRVLKGEVEIMVGDKTTLLREGDMAFAPKNIVHSWKIVGTDNASMCTSAFPAGIEHMFAELGKLPPGAPDFEMVSGICAKYGVRFV